MTIEILIGLCIGLFLICITQWGVLNSRNNKIYILETENSRLKKEMEQPSKENVEHFNAVTKQLKAETERKDKEINNSHIRESLNEALTKILR